MAAELLQPEGRGADRSVAGRRARQLSAHCPNDGGTRPDLGLPHTRAMGGGLFEVRAKGREGIGRAFYCTVTGQRILILHAFIKKSEQTPARELETARARLKEVKA